MSAKYKLGIVIPCFNEGKRANLQLFREYINESKDYIFCFVNDGSTDRTHEILAILKDEFPDKVVVFNNSINQGKAEAVRVGMNYFLTCKITYIGFIDADLPTPMSEVERLFEIITTQKQLNLVFGSRATLHNPHIKRSRFRQWTGKLFAKLARRALKMDIYDTQCGLKIFHSDLAALVFKYPFRTKWLFDVEIFARAKNIYGTSRLSELVQEVPLYRWEEIKGSKLIILDYIKIPFQFMILAIDIKSNFLKRRLQ
ncbi:glycosyltransferase [Chitinophaga silvatica]|uniref:glycosyltransferase n=1 Tax=Chitinophaga silvatica TaxID=2282649 RepID=UPI0013145218|nr:glycosyltransferase [Chitinophaga silvatica]